MSTKKPPVKRTPTRRSTRSVARVIESNLIFSGPVLALANELRRRADTLAGIRKEDELIEILRGIAAEIFDAVQEGRKNEWLDVATFAQLTGLEQDTVRKHCAAGKISPAKKIGGVWLIHRSALELDDHQEAA